MIVGVYCRVSTYDKQDINMQVDFLNNYCKLNNLSIYNIYEDVGQSGAKESRPQFDILLKDIRDKKINTVLVYKLDRIGRSLSHLIKLFEEFKRHNIKFISATQNINTTTPEGELFLNIIMVLADYERKLTRARVIDGLAQARAKGKPIGKRGKDKGVRRKSGYYNRWSKKVPPQESALI